MDTVLVVSYIKSLLERAMVENLENKQQLALIKWLP